MAQYRRRRVQTRKANILDVINAVFNRISRRTKLILLGAAAVIIIAAVVIVLLPKDGHAQVGSLDKPVPTETNAEPTPVLTPVPTTAPMVTPNVTLKEGDDNEDVQYLQEQLVKLGYLDLDETTTKFGPATVQAVKWLQRQVGIEQTGIADGETQAWLYASDAKHYTLLEGFEGEDVKKFQKRLHDLGYLKSVTGHYGTDTVKAVKALQQRNKLAQDGKLGENTMDLIYSPNVKPDPSVVEALKSKANVNEMIAAAKSKIGKPYVSGAEGPNSFDCSGFVYFCLKAAGSERGRYNAAGYAKVDDWQKISSINGLKKGDLMFFWDDGKGKIGHVAIYIGGGMMIDASSSNGKVVRRSATGSWCRRQFKWGRRPW